MKKIILLLICFTLTLNIVVASSTSKMRKIGNDEVRYLNGRIYKIGNDEVRY